MRTRYSKKSPSCSSHQKASPSESEIQVCPNVLHVSNLLPRLMSAPRELAMRNPLPLSLPDFLPTIVMNYRDNVVVQFIPNNATFAKLLNRQISEFQKVKLKNEQLRNKVSEIERYAKGFMKPKKPASSKEHLLQSITRPPEDHWSRQPKTSHSVRPPMLSILFNVDPEIVAAKKSNCIAKIFEWTARRTTKSSWRRPPG